MANTYTVGIVSDIHFASAAEQARGNDYEWRDVTNPLLRFLIRFYRRHLWLRDPLNQNHLLDRFLERSNGFDYLIANGDYAVNTSCFGLSDDAALQGATECIEKLRQKFGDKLRLNIGDHELGKLSIVGGRGGMRLASWQRAIQQLKLEPFWQLQLGNYVLLNVVSSLVAFPAFEADARSSERAQWQELRTAHLDQVRQAFDSLKPTQRIVLFCHDPTALPFLWKEESVRSRLPQLEQTIIGHLHSNLILWKSRLLAGIPRITFLGHTAKKLSSALREARHWRFFRVRLCPALAGIELLKDGGYLTAELETDARQSAKFQLHRLPHSAK